MANLDLFTPVVPATAFHPNFANSIASPDHQAERDVISAWTDGFQDRDGKFVKEFQTTFNSGFWELYLTAVFREIGCSLDFTHHAPDFVASRGEQKFCAEATIASNASGYAPEWAGQQLIDSAESSQSASFLELATLRLSNSIVSKHKKFLDSYAGLEWVRGKPFVLCVAAFEQPFAFEQNDGAIRRVLYGFDQPLYTQHGDERVVLGEAHVQSVTKESGASVPLGLFTHPALKEVSAVIFSSLATWGKVRALAGVGSSDETVLFRSVRYDAGATVPKLAVTQRPGYVETLLDGVHVCLNPFATYPFDPSIFDGQMVCLHAYDAEARQYLVEAPDGCLIHRFIQSIKSVDDPAAVVRRQTASASYKRHQIQPWTEGMLVPVGGNVGPFDMACMANYCGWTIVVAHDATDDDWCGQAIHALCQSLPEYVMLNASDEIELRIGEPGITPEQALESIKRLIEKPTTERNP